MIEKKQKIITYVGLWLAAIAGSSTALIFIIAGYILNWGPGGDMEGPLWRILLVGIPSVLAGVYIGVLVVRIIAKKLFSVRWTNNKNTIRAFVIIFLGCIAAIIVGWEVAAILGKVTEAIEGLDWTEVLVNSPVFATLYAIAISLVVSILYALFVLIFLMSGDKQPGNEIAK